MFDSGSPFIKAHLSAELIDGKLSPVRALPWGESKLRDAAVREQFDEPGTLLVNERTAVEVPANFEKRDVDYYVNLDHMRGKAYGWITDVEVKEGDGILLGVDWTKEGAVLVEDKAYRYSSIEVILDGSQWLIDGSPAVAVAVTGLALVNNPAVVGQDPVGYATLSAALSACDGRLRESESTPRMTGEKGDHHMADGFYTGLFSRMFGRKPTDEVEAAEMAAEFKTALAERDQLRVDFSAATAKVTELTAQLATISNELAGYKAAEAQTKEQTEAATVDLAVKTGKLPPHRADWAKANYQSFLSFVNDVEEGTFTPPAGKRVTTNAINAPDSTNLGAAPGNDAVLDAEIKAYCREHKVEYHVGWLAVSKQRAEAARGEV